MVKNLPAMQESWVQFLGWKDLLEEGMEAHSSMLAWRLLWTEGPGELYSMGVQRAIHEPATKHKRPHLNSALKFHYTFSVWDFFLTLLRTYWSF